MAIFGAVLTLLSVAIKADPPLPTIIHLIMREQYVYLLVGGLVTAGALTAFSYSSLKSTASTVIGIDACTWIKLQKVFLYLW